MPRPRKNSPNPGHLPFEQLEPNLSFPNLELPGELPTSQVTSWRVLSLSSCSFPSVSHSLTLPLWTRWGFLLHTPREHYVSLVYLLYSVFVPVVQCLVTCELGFRLAEAFLARTNTAVNTGDHLGRSEDLQA